MDIRAAVVRKPNELQVESVQVDEPGPGEVLVRMKAAGICHSDLHTLEGQLRTPPPLVLGHEGAGIVERAGPGVSYKPGDRVLINWLPGCAVCSACQEGYPALCERLASTTLKGRLPTGETRMRSGSTELSQMLSSATMAEYTVVAEEGLVPLMDGIPFEVGAITGCAVLTGVGAVTNTARVHPGTSAAVIGLGGVGLSALLGARLAGCTPVIAVDVVPAKLDLARRLGATYTVNAAQVDTVEALQELTDGGPAYVFDSVGSSKTIPQALNAARRAGTAVIMGLHSVFQDIPISPATLIFDNKRLLGSFAGESRPHVDLPRLQRLYLDGRLALDELVVSRYTLTDLPDAFAEMKAGTLLGRSVLIFDD